MNSIMIQTGMIAVKVLSENHKYTAYVVKNRLLSELTWTSVLYMAWMEFTGDSGAFKVIKSTAVKIAMISTTTEFYK